MLSDSKWSAASVVFPLYGWPGLILFFLLLSGGLPVRADGLFFRVEGDALKEVSREELARTLSLKTLVTENPTTGKKATYQGVDLIDLLNLGFGDRWKRYDAVKFVSRDGYQPLMTPKTILAHRGLAAFREDGRDGLNPFQRGRGEMVDPGPFWVVWDVFEDPAAKSDPWVSWPWQLVGMELVRLDLEFPRAAPPADASEEVKRGFTAFLQHCVKCHRINGEGGDIGPELNYPVSVTEYWQPAWLPKFIADPRSVKWNSKMVGFYPGVQNREAIIRDIVAYLNVMARHKIEPNGMSQSEVRLRFETQ
ncbi:Cytochrome c domain-containing protein [Methylocaldum szegediense]|uniref:Cytochrome c domain-containing protein n=1 Tax=Methylocaldum szegediense TaxID=73780 RepID=A0ABN8X5P8_9GAMM|nr:Cytochrome c domain-containing protein [Methylocaldum szegediense]